MSYKVKSLEAFERKAARLIKKYPSLKTELFDLVEKLKISPGQWTALGNNCYKIRLSSISKGKGKSGGARIIINIVVFHIIVYLLTIYDNSEKENLRRKDLRELLKEVPL